MYSNVPDTEPELSMIRTRATRHLNTEAARVTWKNHGRGSYMTSQHAKTRRDRTVEWRKKTPEPIAHTGLV